MLIKDMSSKVITSGPPVLEFLSVLKPSVDCLMYSVGQSEIMMSHIIRYSLSDCVFTELCELQRKIYIIFITHRIQQCYKQT